MRSDFFTRIFLCVALLFFITPDTFTQTAKVLKKETQIGYTPGSKGELIPDQSSIIKFYDKNGFLTEELNERIWPEMQKKAVLKRIYTYDSTARLSFYELFNDEKFSLKLEYHYDSNGVLKKTQEINSAMKPGFHSLKFYDSTNLLTNEELYSPKGQLYSVKQYRYDVQKNLIEEWGKEGTQMKYKWVYFYDKKNVLQKRDDYNGASVLLRSRRYEYNQEGKILKETILNAEKKVERVVLYNYEYW